MTYESCLPGSGAHQRGHAVLPQRNGQTAPEGAAERWVAVIDDHPSMRSSLARALRLDGFSVEMFASAEDYLRRSGESDPFCLVLDMQLPGMKGHELAHLLEREHSPAPPTIFISAHEDLLASLDGCCASHGRLRKPFDIDALLALLKPLV